MKLASELASELLPPCAWRPHAMLQQMSRGPREKKRGREGGREGEGEREERPERERESLREGEGSLKKVLAHQ